MRFEIFKIIKEDYDKNGECKKTAQEILEDYISSPARTLLLEEKEKYKKFDLEKPSEREWLKEKIIHMRNRIKSQGFKRIYRELWFSKDLMNNSHYLKRIEDYQMEMENNKNGPKPLIPPLPKIIEETSPTPLPEIIQQGKEKKAPQSRRMFKGVFDEMLFEFFKIIKDDYDKNNEFKKSPIQILDETGQLVPVRFLGTLDTCT